MNIAQIVTIVDTAGNTLPAIVVGKSNARVPANAQTGAEAHVQPCASVRVFPKSGGELPYITNVPVYDTIEEATAPNAGKFSAYAIYASPANESADLSIPDVDPEPVAPPAPVVEQPVTFDEE